MYKLIGTNTASQLNSANPYAEVFFDDAVLYPNPYMVITPQGYTKHYYAGTERLVTVIGGGGFGDMESPIDWETRYDYFGARYYWQAGTWLSVDPLADENPGKSPYMYCSWNPISRIDPDGRADYYDVDGNHLCNDGVADNRVLQQNINGDVVLGGYATPFSYVGDVDKISLSYDGEMISDSKSQGTLTVTQYVGDKQFSRGFSAISGNGSTKDGNAFYTLQNGDYICYDYTPNVCQKGYVKDGIGFKIWLKTTEGWNTQRDGLQIHPDQYPPGTKGCIGLTGTASELSLFQKMVSPFTSGGNTSPLSVSINGNPQCCRAVDKAKGWFVPLFSK